MIKLRCSSFFPSFGDSYVVHCGADFSERIRRRRRRPTFRSFTRRKTEERTSERRYPSQYITAGSALPAAPSSSLLDAGREKAVGRAGGPSRKVLQ